MGNIKGRTKKFDLGNGCHATMTFSNEDLSMSSEVFMSKDVIQKAKGEIKKAKDKSHVDELPFMNLLFSPVFFKKDLNLTFKKDFRNSDFGLPEGVDPNKLTRRAREEYIEALEKAADEIPKLIELMSKVEDVTVRVESYENGKVKTYFNNKLFSERQLDKQAMPFFLAGTRNAMLR